MFVTRNQRHARWRVTVQPATHYLCQRCHNAGLTLQKLAENNVIDGVFLGKDRLTIMTEEVNTFQRADLSHIY